MKVPGKGNNLGNIKVPKIIEQKQVPLFKKHYSKEYKKKILNTNIKNTCKCTNKNLLIPDDCFVIANAGLNLDLPERKSSDVSDIVINEEKIIKDSVRCLKKIRKVGNFMGYETSFYCNEEGGESIDPRSINDSIKDGWTVVKKGPCSYRKNVGNVDLTINDKEN